MSDAGPNTCPDCGAELAADATYQACPACLISFAIVRGDEEAPAPAPSPSTEFPRELGGYRLTGLLGRGGMGTVYEAEHTATGRRVALKMLEQRIDSPELRQRFLREGRLAAGINHPNSLYVYGSEEIDSVPVITMEIAGGGTLGDRLDRQGPLPVAAAVDAILDVIDGLEAAAAVGVLHRDIKPANCFVDPDGSVKVGDFGISVSTLSRDDSYATADGVILGTPAFAAPEQLRGDRLDSRADIYSTGATLFALLTAQAPFEGRNVVQVVANVLEQPPPPLRERREDTPPGLEQIVTRCLAKEPEGRYDDYRALRDALLPFSSGEPEPASLTVRASAGWIDFLIAFLVPYVPLMLSVGNEQFHLGFLMERTAWSARHYLLLLLFAVLYFTIAEGIFGGGPGKRMKGLRVVRKGGRRPGLGRALIRILIPILSAEGVRIPLLLLTISFTRIDDMTTAEIVIYSTAAALCPWIPILLSLTARRENGFATLWDRVSGTRVVVRRKGAVRPSIDPLSNAGRPAELTASFGPFEVTREVARGCWLLATDPVLRREVWLRRRESGAASMARRNLARAGRTRWLQQVETADGVWDAFEAPPGAPLGSLVADGKRLPWGTLRHWLLDLATEMMAAVRDGTLPMEASLDHVWITARGQAVLLDEPWPPVAAPAGRIPVGDVAGQQRFLSAVADCVEPTGLPLHARPVLGNLAEGRFEKLSFLSGTLRGYRDRPAEVDRRTRAASIFLLPGYIWLMVFLGSHQGAEWLDPLVGSSPLSLALAAALLVLFGSALVKLLVLPFGTSISHATFRLAVVDANGAPASRRHLLARWTIVWLPFLLPASLGALRLGGGGGVARLFTLVLILLWIGAGVQAVRNPNRGWHDRLARTWVVHR